MSVISPAIFRAYDVRGIYQENFTEACAQQIGHVFGSKLVEQGNDRRVFLGRDGRLSSPSLFKAVEQGLHQAGCDVFDLGLIPSPLLYFAIQHSDIQHGMIITGSHNPAHHNGIKLVMQGICQHSSAVKDLYHRITQKQFHHTPKQGKTYHHPILGKYLDHISQAIQIKRPLNIAIDCSHGATGVIAQAVFNSIGCHVTAINHDVDGRFPNHSPDPTVPENLVQLRQTVIQDGLDFGIAFDGDGDRIIAVDGEGNILWPDRILLFLAQHILPKYPDRAVVFDVKSTASLKHTILQQGGQPKMCPTGHSLLKASIQEHNAVLGGEFSGHLILRDRGVDYDDAMYIAARLLSILSELPTSPTQAFANIPNSFTTPEHRISFPNYDAANHAMQHWYNDPSGLQADHIITLDGLRAEYQSGWGLARCSNTAPDITLRFEAQTEPQLEFIKDCFRKDIHRLQLANTVPF